MRENGTIANAKIVKYEIFDKNPRVNPAKSEIRKMSKFLQYI